MIKSFENVLTIDQYKLLSDIFYYNHIWMWGAKTDDNSARLWQVNFIDNNGDVNPIILDIWKSIIKNFDLGGDYEIINLYANGQTFGMNGDWHKDSQDAGRYTFLIYFTKGDESLIGDTEFKMGGMITSNAPKTNTAILFPSNIEHRGCGPKKEFKDLRITIAFKLLKKNNTLL
jgi:hypothetical protein